MIRTIGKHVLGGLAAMLPDATRARYGAPTMEWTLQRIRYAGFRPHSLIVDVGAYHGEWTTLARRYFEAPILMVEAQESKADRLRAIAARDGLTEYRIALLGRESGREVTFYEMETGSSVFAEQTDVARIATTRITETLDSVVGDRPVSLLKLDVQGYELEVLNGASRVLESAHAIMTEVSFLPYNEGAPLVHDVQGFLHDRGFVAFDICSLMRRAKDGALFQADMLFVRHDSFLRR